MISAPLAVMFRAVIGLALGLRGAGGSILAVPALVYGVGQSLHPAISTPLAVVALSSLGGLAHVRAAAPCDGRSRWYSVRRNAGGVWGRGARTFSTATLATAGIRRAHDRLTGRMQRVCKPNDVGLSRKNN